MIHSYTYIFLILKSKIEMDLIRADYNLCDLTQSGDRFLHAKSTRRATEKQ